MIQRATTLGALGGNMSNIADPTATMDFMMPMATTINYTSGTKAASNSYIASQINR